MRHDSLTAYMYTVKLISVSSKVIMLINYTTQVLEININPSKIQTNVNCRNFRPKYNSNIINKIINIINIDAKPVALKHKIVKSAIKTSYDIDCKRNSAKTIVS